MSEPKKRSSMPVSVSMETYQRMQRFLEQFGDVLGYSSSPGRYVGAAIVEKMERDERRLERIAALRRLRTDRGELDWSDLD